MVHARATAHLAVQKVSSTKATHDINLCLSVLYEIMHYVYTEKYKKQPTNNKM